jgi:hypothetical protein
MILNGRRKIMKKMQAMEADGWQVEKRLSTTDLEWTVRKWNALAVIRYTKRGKVEEIIGNTISTFNNVEYYHPFNTATKKAFREMLETI